VQHFDETDYGVPTEAANKKIGHTLDEELRFMCVVCSQPFSAMNSKLPYLVPCQHNVCSDCANKTQSIGHDFTCPKDHYFLQNVDDLKINENLLREIKLKERRLKKEREEEERKKIEMAERAIQLENEKERKTGMDLLGRLEEGRPDYDLIDGAKVQAAGTDKMRKLMKEE
jgi:hypothetical protein